MVFNGKLSGDMPPLGKCIWPWFLTVTLKVFSVKPTHMMNMYVKSMHKVQRYRIMWNGC